MSLTDLSVRQARATSKTRSILDGDGLYLFIPLNGRSKAWHFRFTIAGQDRCISFGTHPEVSLREARALRRIPVARLEQREKLKLVVSGSLPARHDSCRSIARQAVDLLPGAMFPSRA